MSPGPQRLVFIDTARAIAIVSMLQGHFINVALVDAVRDVSDPVYLFHAQLRSMTAPLFLTVSGMVFAFFLCADTGGTRVRRGLRRGAMLIGLGHFLQLNFELWLSAPARAAAALLHCHVLNVVGVGLLILVAAHALARSARLPVTLAMAAAGLGAFLLTPIVRVTDFSALPRLLQNYLTTDHGSVFTLFPWLGYMGLGGACGALVHRFVGDPTAATATLRRLGLAACFAALGLGLRFGAVAIVYRTARACPPGLDCSPWFPMHVWLSRAGTLIALCGLLLALEPALRRTVPRALLHAGQRTLSIFVVHGVVLYGALTGYGIARLIRRQLSPAEAILGAVLFVAMHVALGDFLARRRSEPRALNPTTPADAATTLGGLR